DGIRWAAGLSVTGVPNNPYPVQVINMSLGGGGSCDATSQNAINDAVAAGTTVVVAAGNNNANASNYSPASCNNVITVAATNRDGSRAYYSNYGSVVEISAPGGAQSYANDPNGVLSTLNTGTQGPVADSYEYYQGTSMAAPHVAGVASLVLSMDPSLTPAEILTILQNTVTPFPGGSTCNTSICGSGIVNAGLAVQSANPPIIEVDPASLEVGLTPESQLTQTLTISNSGGDDLTWAITESVTIASLPADPLIAAEAAVTRGGDLNFALDTAEPAAEDAQVAPRPDVSPTFVTPIAVLLDTVQLVNSPGTGAGGADESMVQNSSLGMTSLGFGHQVANGNRVADDFTIADPGGWQIDTITFFAYQTGSPTASTITAVNLRIWDGPPNDPASTVVFGDTTTNRLSSSAWSGIYRVSETSSGGTTRPIMANVVTVNIQLPPGTYWLDWQEGGTLTSGPWAPPITINGQTTTGNALQYTGSWAAALDVGTLTPQGLPFIIDGNAIAAATCSPTSDLSWVSVAPLSGTLTPGANESLDVIFDSTGLTTGEYTGTLCLDSNDPVTPQVQVPLTMTVCTQPAAVTDVSISRGGSDINLSWSTVSGATSYRIYRAANSPYFSSGPLFIYDLALSNSYTDASVTGDPANNYYYIVQSVSACGAGAVESGHSNRTAKFEYPLQPGTP
ncbi:MAG TPA: hypothetical protein DEH25_11285, partial [Chloroflexi bacterium]|nr:hypothetical protein [Chloroflexota bacterium]